MSTLSQEVALSLNSKGTLAPQAWSQEIWLSPESLSQEEAWQYWNDESQELAKHWNVEANGFGQMEDYIQRKGLVYSIQAATAALQEQFQAELHGEGLDLAAGTLWATANLLQCHPAISKIRCVEYSQHRLFKIGTKILAHYKIPAERVQLCLGSFYDLRIPDTSQDFVFLSQAFHHAAEPLRLVHEIDRVLKPGGFVVIIGEHLNHYPKALAKHWLKLALQLVPAKLQQSLFGKVFRLTSSRLVPSFHDLFPFDPVKGDRHYTPQDYAAFFDNFDVERLVHAPYRLQSYILKKRCC